MTMNSLRPGLSATASDDVETDDSDSPGGGEHASRLEPKVAAIAAVAVVGMLVASGYVDFITGYEVSTFSLYALPIVLATALFGTFWGMLTACVATALWILADVGDGHEYAHAWMLLLNAMHRFLFFVLAVVSTRALMKLSRLRRLERLSVCVRCDMVSIRRGEWLDAEAALRELYAPAIHHKLCPHCAREHYADEPAKEASSLAHQSA